MRVCVVGAGGREHALAQVLARTADVVVTPGNPGIPWSTPAPPVEVEADLYVIGPEAPLVDGLGDRLRARGRLVFGPGADGAVLEGSKAWMKDVLVAAGVPTAAHRSYHPGDEGAAVDFLKSLPGPYVVKTDGLAAGKGVLVTDDLAEWNYGDYEGRTTAAIRAEVPEALEARALREALDREAERLVLDVALMPL